MRMCKCIAMYCLGLGIFGVCGPSFGFLVQHPYMGHSAGRPLGGGAWACVILNSDYFGD